jgi:hypothetical protein
MHSFQVASARLTTGSLPIGFKWYGKPTQEWNLKVDPVYRPLALERLGKIVAASASFGESADLRRFCDVRHSEVAAAYDMRPFYVGFAPELQYLGYGKYTLKSVMEYRRKWHLKDWDLQLRHNPPPYWNEFGKYCVDMERSGFCFALEDELVQAAASGYSAFKKADGNFAALPCLASGPGTLLSLPESPGKSGFLRCFNVAEYCLTMTMFSDMRGDITEQANIGGMFSERTSRLTLAVLVTKLYMQGIVDMGKELFTVMVEYAGEVGKTVKQILPGIPERVLAEKTVIAGTGDPPPMDSHGLFPLLDGVSRLFVPGSEDLPLLERWIAVMGKHKGMLDQVCSEAGLSFIARCINTPGISKGICMGDLLTISNPSVYVREVYDDGVVSHPSNRKALELGQLIMRKAIRLVTQSRLLGEPTTGVLNPVPAAEVEPEYA